MSKALTVRELLNGQTEGFDPLSIDTSEIRVLSESLPRDGQIDLNQAEILATKFLRGADICGELMAIATCHVSKLETTKKKAYSNAALAKASASGIKTDRSRLLFADADPDYIEVCNKHSEGVAFLRWVGSKYDSFVRAHYNCKKLLDRYYSHEKTASFVGSNEKLADENSWDNNKDNSEDNEMEDEFGKEW